MRCWMPLSSKSVYYYHYCHISSIMKWVFFSSKAVYKDQDSSCKMDLDLWDLIRREKPFYS